MSFKLNTELVNTAAVVEAAAPEITEAAKEAVNNTVEPVHTGDTIRFGTAGNFESSHKGYLIWDEGVAYENHHTLKNVTQIKQNKGFKVKAAANATITITFYTNYGQYFLVDDVRVTSDVYTITTTEDKEIYVTTDLAGGAYIVSFYISKTNFSINDVLFKNVMPLGGGSGIRVDGSLSAGYSYSGEGDEDDYYAVDFNLQHNNIRLQSCADGGDYTYGELKITDSNVNMHVHEDHNYDSDFTMGNTTIDLSASYSGDATKIHLAPTTFEATVCDTSTDPETVKQALTLSDTGFNTETDAVNMETADYYSNGKLDDIAKLNIVPTNILLSTKDYEDFDTKHALVTEAGISISADDVQMAINLPENEDRSEYRTKNTSFRLAGENEVFSVNTHNGYGHNTSTDTDYSINGHISMFTYDGTNIYSVSNSRIELYIQNNDNDLNPTSKIELKPEAITIDNDGYKVKVAQDGISLESDSISLGKPNTNRLSFSTSNLPSRGAGAGTYSLTNYYNYELTGVVKDVNNSNSVNITYCFTGPEWFVDNTPNREYTQLTAAQANQILDGKIVGIDADGTPTVGYANLDNGTLTIKCADGRTFYLKTNYGNVYYVYRKAKLPK